MLLHSAVLKEIKRRSAAEFVRTRQAVLSSCRDVVFELVVVGVFRPSLQKERPTPPIYVPAVVLARSSFVFLLIALVFFLFSFPGFQGTIFRMSF